MNAPVEISVQQNTLEWFEHRANYRNASETPYIMSLVVKGYKYPFGNERDMFLIKTGRKVVDANYAMRRGSALEPMARRLVENIWGKPITTSVMVNGKYSASLDGICGTDIFEIKTPAKGRESETWKAAAALEVPQHYFYQIQHQLMVTGASRAFFVVYDGKDAVTMVKVEPDQTAFNLIQQAWDKFQEFLDKDEEPIVEAVRNDPEWIDAAVAYKLLKKAQEELQVKVDAAKQNLLNLATEAKQTGAGVTVTKYTKKGAVNYKAIPELKGVDLEQYRAEETDETRITLEKE